MAEFSGIQWTTHTMNPWRGCTKVSPGCANCYAETGSGRNPKVLGVWGPKGTRVVAAEAQWRLPVKWNFAALAAYDAFSRAIQQARSEYDAVAPYERPRVFCASLADVFEDWKGPMETPQGVQLFKRVKHNDEWTTSDHYRDTVALTMDDVRARLFHLIDATPYLDWLILTKRPENIGRMMPRPAFDHAGWNGTLDGYWHQVGKPRPNVWLGTSVENQAAADSRIPELLKIPAAIRFLSVEPLLGPVEFSDVTKRSDAAVQWGKKALDGIDWVIIGGESGHDARRCEVGWVRSIVKQCKAVGVAAFVKQLGAHPTEAGDFAQKTGPVTGLRLLDKKGGDMSEWPRDLRVREFPEVAHA